jgi:hypothetical protein
LAELQNKDLTKIFKFPTKTYITNKIKSIRGSNVIRIKYIFKNGACLTQINGKIFRRFWQGDIKGKDHKIAVWSSEFWVQTKAF